MAVNTYECLVIFDSNRYARDAAAASGNLTKVVESFGGEMLASRLWEERRLTYPIKGQRKGTYWLSYFKLDAVKLLDVERQLQLDENILRSLTLKIDARIADTLVQHALTGAKPVHEHPSGAETAQPTTAG